MKMQFPLEFQPNLASKLHTPSGAVPQQEIRITLRQSIEAMDP